MDGWQNVLFGQNVLIDKMCFWTTWQEEEGEMGRVVEVSEVSPEEQECRHTIHLLLERYVKSVFVIHVGGTRCVTSSTNNIMKIHACITLNVEFIRTCIFIF
jgi:hypothetical protein